MEAEILILLVLNLFSIFFCYYVAKRREAKVGFWVLMGALLGPIAIPFVFFAKPVEKNNLK